MGEYEEHFVGEPEGKHEGSAFIEITREYRDRIPILFGNDIVRKTMSKAKNVDQPLGDSLIVCIEMLVIEVERLRRLRDDIIHLIRE